MAALDSITPDAQILDDQGRDWAWSFVVFRDAKDFPGYVLSSIGDVWSRLKRGGPRRDGQGVRLGDTWRRRAQSIDSDGYPSVSLARGGRLRAQKVHKLMLEAFVCEKPDGLECRHLNGNRRDNRIINLIWGTTAENIEDRRRHGTDNRGERHPLCKYSSEQVAQIRKLRAEGISRAEITAMFGIHRTHISQITSNKARRFD